MRTTHNSNRKTSSFSKFLKSSLLVLPLLAFGVPDLQAQVLNPRQLTSSGFTCPADYPGNNKFNCKANDIKLDLVTLTDLNSCTEGVITTATFEVDLAVNANIRYNPMIWISQNGLSPAVSGSAAFLRPYR